MADSELMGNILYGCDRRIMWRCNDIHVDLNMFDDLRRLIGLRKIHGRFFCNGVARDRSVTSFFNHAFSLH